jgi:hypothetical protein
VVEELLSFVQANKPYFDVAQSLSLVVNLFAWSLTVFLLIIALRKSRIESLSVGPFSFKMQQEAVDASVRFWVAA